MGRSLKACCHYADGWGRIWALTVLILSRVYVQCAVNTVRNCRRHKDDGYTSVQNSSGKGRAAARWSDIDLSSFSVHIDRYGCDGDFPERCTVVFRDDVGIVDFAWIGDIIRGMPANPQ